MPRTCANTALSLLQGCWQQWQVFSLNPYASVMETCDHIFSTVQSQCWFSERRNEVSRRTLPCLPCINSYMVSGIATLSWKSLCAPCEHQMIHCCPCGRCRVWQCGYPEASTSHSPSISAQACCCSQSGNWTFLPPTPSSTYLSPLSPKHSFVI